MGDTSFINLNSPDEAFQYGRKHLTGAQDMEDAVMTLIRKTVGVTEGMNGYLAGNMNEVAATVKTQMQHAALDVARVGLGIEKGTNTIVEGDNTAGQQVGSSALRRPI